MAIFYIPNTTQYLNLTTSLLTINKQQIRSLLRLIGEKFTFLECTQILKRPYYGFLKMTFHAVGKTSSKVLNLKVHVYKVIVSHVTFPFPSLGLGVGVTG